MASQLAPGVHCMPQGSCWKDVAGTSMAELDQSIIARRSPVLSLRFHGSEKGALRQTRVGTDTKACSQPDMAGSQERLAVKLAEFDNHTAHTDQGSATELLRLHDDSEQQVSTSRSSFTNSMLGAIMSFMLVSPNACLATPLSPTDLLSEPASTSALLASVSRVESSQEGRVLAVAPEVSVTVTTGSDNLVSSLSALELPGQSAALQSLNYVAPEENAREVFAKKVNGAVAMLEGAKRLQAEGDFQGALVGYTRLVEQHGDLALADYGRVGRALMLYEQGERLDAIYEMEDVSITFKGYPEVHAALAAALYTDKHLPLQAERQFSFATLLDPRYTSLDYVKSEKHWPPSLVASLRTFLTLG